MTESPYKKGSVADLRAWSLTQPAVGRCLFCPEWSVTGTSEEVNGHLAEHRAQEHPETIGYRRRRRRGSGKLNFRQTLTDEQNDEIEAERRRRMRLLGIPD